MKFSGFAARNRALLSGTGLAALVAVGLVSPMSVREAAADCVVAGANPETVVCSAADADGVVYGSADPVGLDAYVFGGASVSSPGVGMYLGNSAGGFVNVEIDGAVDSVEYAVAADGTGEVTVDSTEGTVSSANGAGILARTSGGSATIESGAVSAGGDLAVHSFTDPSTGMTLNVGGGVIAYANQDATVSAHGKITVTDTDTSDGVVTFGAAAISEDGAATVNLNGNTIDPPIIGSMALVLGGAADATVNADGSTIDATLAGVLGANYGTGNVIINADDAVIGATTPPSDWGILGYTDGGGAVEISAKNATVNSGDVGIEGTTDIGGDVTILAQGSTINAASVGIDGTAALSSGFGNVRIESGTVNVTSGLGIDAWAFGGDVDIDTYGHTTVNGGAGGDFAILGQAIGGSVDINLQGTTVKHLTGQGVIADSFGFGNAAVHGQGSTVNAETASAHSPIAVTPPSNPVRSLLQMARVSTPRPTTATSTSTPMATPPPTVRGASTATPSSRVTSISPCMARQWSILEARA